MSEQKSAAKSNLLSLSIKIALTLVVLYFVYDQFVSQWSEIRDYQWQIDIFYLLISVVTGMIALLIMSTTWRSVIGMFGHNLSVGSAFRIFYLSNLGRYIPGKVWQLFGILYLTRQKGIPSEQAGASFIIVQLFAIPASFLLFVIAVQFEPLLLVDQVKLLNSSSWYLVTGMLLGSCVVLTVRPNWILALGNRLLRKMGRPEVTLQIDFRVALKLFSAYVCGWIGYGIAFYFLVSAVVPDCNLGLLPAIGLFNAAYQIGYLVLFAPGGFGPRELVMSALLAPFIGKVALVVALAARIWSLILESIAAGCAIIIKK